MEKNEIWAGFGSVGSTEKKIWANYEQLLRAGFHGQKKCLTFFEKHCSVCTKKLHNIYLIRKKNVLIFFAFWGLKVSCRHIIRCSTRGTYLTVRLMYDDFVYT